MATWFSKPSEACLTANRAIVTSATDNASQTSTPKNKALQYKTEPLTDLEFPHSKSKYTGGSFHTSYKETSIAGLSALPTSIEENAGNPTNKVYSTLSIHHFDDRIISTSLSSSALAPDVNTTSSQETYIEPPLANDTTDLQYSSLSSHEEKTFKSPDSAKASATETSSPQHITEISVDYKLNSHYFTTPQRSIFGSSEESVLEHHSTNKPSITETNNELPPNPTMNSFSSVSAFPSITAKYLLTPVFSSEVDRTIEMSLRPSGNIISRLHLFDTAVLEGQNSQKIHGLLAYSPSWPLSMTQGSVSDTKYHEDNTHMRSLTSGSETNLVDNELKTTMSHDISTTSFLQLSSLTNIGSTNDQSSTNTDDLLPSKTSTATQNGAENMMDGTGASTSITEGSIKVVLGSAVSAVAFLFAIFFLHRPLYQLMRRIRMKHKPEDARAKEAQALKYMFSDNPDMHREVSRFSEDS